MHQHIGAVQRPDDRRRGPAQLLPHGLADPGKRHGIVEVEEVEPFAAGHRDDLRHQSLLLGRQPGGIEIGGVRAGHGLWQQRMQHQAG